MYCRNCGNKLNDDAKFCGKCGTATANIKEEKEVVKEKIEPIIKEVEDIDVKLESKSSTPVVLLLVIITMFIAIGLIIGINLL